MEVFHYLYKIILHGGCKTREDLNLINKNIETVFIEVDQIGLSRNAIIRRVYRSHDTDINTFHNITNVLTFIYSENATAYLI